jgi:uncharacterized protein (DUF924 family)
MYEFRPVLDFWFGNSPDDAIVADEKTKLWWGKDSDIDEIIREKFSALRDAVIAGALNHRLELAHCRLACIILVDQFSRNLFRNDARAFAYDWLARQWCVNGLATDVDRQLRPIERLFFYLPLEHSESIDDQDRSVALFRALRTEVPEIQRTLFDNFLDFAEKHREILARFGRFPHRNIALGRGSTPEEIEFLKQPGSTF